jgi:hypothetical protein
MLPSDKNDEKLSKEIKPPASKEELQSAQNKKQSFKESDLLNSKV